MYVVLEWICQIRTKFSEAKLRHISLNGFARLARYLSFWVLWKQNSRCGRERMQKTEVPRDVRNSEVQRQDKFRRYWSQH